MDVRIATFNLENLFTRPSAMKDGSGQKGQQAIDDHAELNSISAKDTYSDHDKARLLELEKRYRFADLNPPASALVQLNKIRGQLFKRTQAGIKSVVATGRSSWTGWFELKRDDIKWAATYNTGRVIAETNADIVLCIEVENRPTLQRFNEQVLNAEFNASYPHVMVIDGNDQRGIDVGVMSRYPINGIRSHVDDVNPNGERTFSRDCPEYVIELSDTKRIVIIPNHFKSKRGGDSSGEGSAACTSVYCQRHRQERTPGLAVCSPGRRPERHAEQRDTGTTVPEWLSGCSGTRRHTRSTGRGRMTPGLPATRSTT